MEATTGEKEGHRQMIREAPEVAAPVLAQLAEKLPKLRWRVIPHFRVLDLELRCQALHKRVRRGERLEEQRQRGLDLQMMRRATVARRQLVEFPCPFRRKGLDRESFRRRPSDELSPRPPIRSQGVLGKLPLLGRGSHPVQERVG